MQHAQQEHVGLVVVEVCHNVCEEIIPLRQKSHKKAEKGATQTEGGWASTVVDLRCGDERDSERLALRVLGRDSKL